MKIKLIDFGAAKNGLTPVRAHYNDAGLDCYAQSDFGMLGIGKSDKSHIAKVPLGFGLVIPDGYQAVIKPRSSMNAKGILTQIGTIDSGYRGEISAVFVNLSGELREFRKGDRICQIVVEPVVLAEPVLELDDGRGSGGFGSTGR